MNFLLFLVLSTIILTISYLYKVKRPKRLNNYNLIRNEDIELEKEKLKSKEFDIEYRKYKMSR